MFFQFLFQFLLWFFSFSYSFSCICIGTFVFEKLIIGCNFFSIIVRYWIVQQRISNVICSGAREQCPSTASQFQVFALCRRTESAGIRLTSSEVSAWTTLGRNGIWDMPKHRVIPYSMWFPVGVKCFPRTVISALVYYILLTYFTVLVCVAND